MWLLRTAQDRQIWKDFTFCQGVGIITKLISALPWLKSCGCCARSQSEPVYFTPPVLSQAEHMAPVPDPHELFLELLNMGKIFIYFCSTLIDVNVKSCISDNKTYWCYISDPICSPYLKETNETKNKWQQIKRHYWFLYSNSSARKRRSQEKCLFLTLFSWQSLPILLTSHSTFHFQQTKAGFSNHTADFSTRGIWKQNLWLMYFRSKFPWKSRARKQTGGLTRSKGQRGKKESVEGLGEAATTDTTAVIRPPQNNPEELGSPRAERGEDGGTVCLNIHPLRLWPSTPSPAILCDAALTDALQVLF